MVLHVFACKCPLARALPKQLGVSGHGVSIHRAMFRSTNRLHVWSSPEMPALLENCDGITGTQGGMLIHPEAFETIFVVVFARQETYGCIVICDLRRELVITNPSSVFCRIGCFFKSRSGESFEAMVPSCSHPNLLDQDFSTWRVKETLWYSFAFVFEKTDTKVYHVQSSCTASLSVRLRLFWGFSSTVANLCRLGIQ